MADIELADGRFRFAYKDPSTGRRRYEYCPLGMTKTQARAIMRAFHVQLARRSVGLEPDAPNPNGWNVGQLVAWWLREFVVGKLESAPEMLSRCKHLHSAKIAAVLIDKLKPADVERWLHQLDDKLSPQSVNHLRAHLTRAYNLAAKHGHYVGVNPCAGVDKRKSDNTIVAWLTKTEVRRVLELAVALQPQWAGLYATAIYTGLRKGELFGLRWEDVDLERGVLIVRRSHARKTTKSRKGRAVDVPAELKPWLEAQQGHKSALVFPNPKGKQWSKATKVDVRLLRVLQAAKVKRHIRFHDLRHTFASLFLMSGGDIVALQEVLGHSSIETTRRRYGHLSRAYVRAQMQGFSMAEPKPEIRRPDAPAARKAT